MHQIAKPLYGTLFSPMDRNGALIMGSCDSQLELLPDNRPDGVDWSSLAIAIVYRGPFFGL